MEQKLSGVRKKLESRKHIPKRIVAVSNRLPVTVQEQNGDYVFKESVGGLVSGLKAYLDSLKSDDGAESPGYVWVGWPGLEVPPAEENHIRNRLMEKHNAYPVFISEEENEDFYHGFCNNTIWALFHYFPTYAVYEDSYWEEYVKINHRFAQEISKVLKEGDLVWVHDYHLMLLPRILKEMHPELTIGFFLHIPFPTFEIYRLLPTLWRSEILKGLLGADLIGFHTNDYTKYFLRCVLRLLGYEHTMGKIVVENRVVMAETFPMSIDYNRFENLASSQDTLEEKEILEAGFEGMKVILSIDRLDYSKGILNRLMGYERFLEEYPEWRNKVLLALIVVPSREAVAQYAEMKRQIDEYVGRINGNYGNLNWTPIVYQYRFYAANALSALYTSSDVALITPLRDGMNLIAKEYIASRLSGDGVLILSEMTGASAELGEAILINPDDIKKIADSIREALVMPNAEQKTRIRIMQDRIRKHSVIHWADQFIQSMFEIREEQKRFHSKVMSEEGFKQVKIAYDQSDNRVIFLDYDGTLVPFASRPEQAVPSQETLKILDSLCQDSRNEVVIISGRDRETLEKWLGHLPVGFIAEHGVWIRPKDEEWRMIKPLAFEWKEEVLPLLEMYAQRLPGSFIEEKNFSLVFHYRNAEPETALLRYRELIDDLVNLTAYMDLQVLQGNKVVEVRNSGVNKGLAGLNWLSKKDYDFILGFGDDWTDEDLFRALPDEAFSVRVRLAPTYARFNVKGHESVLKLLGGLAGEKLKDFQF